MSSSPQRGFSLIELLVVMAIVGILTAVAVPQYQSYRAKAFDLRALEDLRSIALAEEAYFLEEEAYLSCSDLGCRTLPGIRRISEGVSVSIEADEDSFVGESAHQTGSGRTFRWDSDQGGLID